MPYVDSKGNVVQGQPSYFGWVFALFTFIAAFFRALFAPFLELKNSGSTSSQRRSGGGRWPGSGGPGGPGGGGGRRPMGRPNNRFMDMSHCTPAGGG
ncbi:hypothetical protein AAVH_26417 [Aphelenchoides avenae]|nr:hypothetical protein AAVH_26417 [Aphelenchus avenae]